MIVLVSALSVQASSFGQTTQPALSATLGFGGVFRPDSWTPVYVEVADPTSRPGTIEVRTARGRVGNVLSTRIQSGTLPTTFTLYAPLDPLDRVAIDWRDDRGKLISQLDLTEQARQNPAALGGPVVGVAGDLAVANRVATSIIRDTGEFVAAGAVATRLLPERAVGLHSIDALVLPGLRSGELGDEAQRQILDWVYAGGIVITWPESPAADSRLMSAVGIGLGELRVREIDGREVAVRDLVSLDAASLDRSDSRTVLRIRRLGLGHVAVFGFDPTMTYRSVEDRVSAMRKATDGQLPLSPADRREGVFDPLVYQARGQEQLTPVVAQDRQWLWIALGLGLVLGPAEALLLLLCRRPIITPLTVAGSALVLGAGLALLVSQGNEEGRTIELVVETESRVLFRSTLATTPTRAQAAWAVGSTVPQNDETAGELSMNQRQDAFEPAGPMRALSAKRPRVHTLDLPNGKPHLLVRGAIADGSALVQSADEAPWQESVWIAGPSLRTLSQAPTPGQAIAIGSHANAPADADDPATARRETALEALAMQEGWEPILMDRHLSARLVALWESESISAVVARRQVAGGTQYVIHLQRP